MKTWTIVVALICTEAVRAAETNAWIGREVMPKEGCRVMDGSRVVDERSITLPMTVRGEQDGWLDIGAGFVRPDDVVDFASAAAYYTDVLRRHPQSDRAYNQRAAVWHKQGELQKAVADYTESIRFDPRDATAYTNRALALSELGEFDRAVEDYRTVVRLDPQGAWGYNGLGWLKATCPDQAFRDGRQAAELATQACRLSRDNPYCLSTLAAAHAELGDFNRAVSVQRQALAAYHGPDQADFERCLQLYQSRLPYRRGVTETKAVTTTAHSSAKR